METRSTAHQNCHRHCPGKLIFFYVIVVVRIDCFFCCCTHLLTLSSPPHITVGVFRSEQPDGGQIQGGKSDDFQAPLLKRLC